MPFLSVSQQGGMCHILFKAGSSVKEILDSTAIKVRSSCGGIGTCGLCTVRVEEGFVNQPTANELNRLGQKRIEKGLRLACQVRLLNDVRITVENQPLRPMWQILNENGSPSPRRGISGSGSNARGQLRTGGGYGVAVDLGTTHIRLSVWNLQTGQCISGRMGLNPQACFGADVLTRLTAATRSPKTSAEIGDLATNAVRDMLLEISEKKGISTKEIGRMVIVGNTAMLALLAGKNPDQLLHSKNWMQELDCRPDDTQKWCATWDLETQTPIDVVPPLAGFVGSDLLAGILSTGLSEGPAGSLLIDFGTNSEMALWDGEVVWVTSAAGGPAFEGCGISSGMPAEPGAIHKVDWKTGVSEFFFKVIGGGQPKGLCGSGLVDIIAGLLERRELKSNGRFSQHGDDPGFMLIEGPDGIALKNRDIDVFQRAKAGIGAGIRCLLENAGLRLQNLQRICVCGAFGHVLNLKNAQAIGLLPTENVEICGNTALAGCECLLFSPDGVATLERLKKKCRVINMSLVSGFDGLFIENLFLKPLKEKETLLP